MNEIPRSRIGPYDLLEPLGSGGMGIVYRACHRDSGQHVALKTILVPHTWMIHGIRREMHVLARISHPGIVRILDEGMEEGIPWYAMELLEGMTLRRYFQEKICAAENEPIFTGMGQACLSGNGITKTAIDENLRTQGSRVPARAHETEDLDYTILPEGSESDEQNPPSHITLPSDYLKLCLTVIRRLCDPLGFMHGEGIIHRDLKPDNVIIKPSGHPVIVDFGLVSRCGGKSSRESLNIEVGASGTMAYMSPEQLRGELVDARADLYSLGCILYELLCGSPPSRQSHASVSRRIFETVTYPSLSSIVAGIPQELEELVDRLLKPSPLQRIGFASDVAEVLEKLGVENGTPETLPQAKSYLYRPGFTGRESQYSQLMERLGRLDQECCGLVLLSGESGVGKTRLATAIGRKAAQRKMMTLVGECIDRGYSPLEALRKPLQWIADLCRENGAEVTDRLLGPRGKVLAMFEPELAGLPGQEHYPDPPELPYAATHHRLMSYLMQTFLSLIEQNGPLLLILDDLQWADDLTLDFLLAFLRFFQRDDQFRTIPLMVLGTFRSEEISTGLQAVLSSEAIEIIHVPRLNAENVDAMVSNMLGLSEVPVTISSAITRHSEGNPFFVAEYLRAVLDEGVLRRDNQGQWILRATIDSVDGLDTREIPLPSSLKELLLRRLERLSPPARHLTEACAVAGREIDLDMLLHLYDQGDSEFLEIVKSLLNEQILEERIGSESFPAFSIQAVHSSTTHDEDIRYRFVHDKIREVVLQNLQLQQKRGLHLSVATSLEKIHHQNLEPFQAQLGYHWEEAGEIDKARKAYSKGAQLAIERFAYPEAEKLLRSLQRLTETPDELSIEARQMLAELVLTRQGKFYDALNEVAAARDEARQIQSRRLELRSTLLTGIFLMRLGKLEEAHKCNEELLTEYGENADDPFMVRILNNLSNTSQALGRIDQCRILTEKAIILAEKYGLCYQEVSSLTNLGHILQAEGRFDEAEQIHMNALSIARDYLNKNLESHVLGNLAILKRDQGLFHEAIQFQEKAITLTIEVGDRPHEGIQKDNLAALYQDVGEVERAESLLWDSLAIAREVDSKVGECSTLTNLAILYHESGQVDLADSTYRDALSIAHAIGQKLFETVVLGRIAILQRQAFGSFDEAERLLDRAELIARDIADNRLVLSCMTERGHLALARGHSGQKFLDQARLMITAMKVGKDSNFSQDVERFHHAQQAFDANQTDRLIHGELIDDIPPEIRLWLINTKKLDPDT